MNTIVKVNARDLIIETLVQFGERGQSDWSHVPYRPREPSGKNRAKAKASRAQRRKQK